MKFLCAEHKKKKRNKSVKKILSSKIAAISLDSPPLAAFTLALTHFPSPALSLLATTPSRTSPNYARALLLADSPLPGPRFSLAVPFHRPIIFSLAVQSLPLVGDRSVPLSRFLSGIPLPVARSTATPFYVSRSASGADVVTLSRGAQSAPRRSPPSVRPDRSAAP